MGPNYKLEAEIRRREDEAAKNAKPAVHSASPMVGEGEANAHSNKTLEKLRGLSRNLSAQLAEARQAHVVRITTLSTELVDVQNEAIAALEARLHFYETWEESREVDEFVKKIDELENRNRNLSEQLTEAEDEIATLKGRMIDRP